MRMSGKEHTPPLAIVASRIHHGEHAQQAMNALAAARRGDLGSALLRAAASRATWLGSSWVQVKFKLGSS